MRKIFIKSVFLVFALIMLNNCQHKPNTGKIEKIIESIKYKYAPDKRVAIFNVLFEVDDSSIKLTGESNSDEGIDSLINKLEDLNYNIMNNIKILPNKELGNKKYGIINLSVANIRSKPSHPAELATQSLLGTCVNVLKEENDWYLIQTPDEYISWVDDDGIHLVDDKEMRKWKDANKVIVTAQYTIAFEQPNEESQNISDLVIGDILKSASKEKDFIGVEFPDGRKGFILSNHVKDYGKWNEDSGANQKSIISSAKNYLGLPYLWGGTSSKGLDCSGFTKTVYYWNGVILPRDASQQVHIGELVDTKDSFSNLLPGDLLFFGRKSTESEKEKVTHVAIYIGDDEYIHSAGRVKINSLNKDASDFNKYRYNTFIRAKRIIGSFDNGDNLVKNNSYYN